MSQWIKVISASAIPQGLGGCVKIGQQQIALFHYGPEEWYALDNECPHKKQMVISRGMLGDTQGQPKIACPLHKNQFTLADGKSLNTELEDLKTFKVKVESGSVYIEI